MGRPSAPSMPTERQVIEAHKTVIALHPKKRIKCIGPDGVHFDYPDNENAASEWDHWSFSGDRV